MKRLYFKRLFLIALLLFTPKIVNYVKAADFIYHEWKGGVLYYQPYQGDLAFDATVIDCYPFPPITTATTTISVLERTDVGSFGNCTVVAIGDTAFEDCNSLIEIKLPETIKTIGNWAFSGCTSLSRINIPKNVYSIGGGAFMDCYNIKELKLPDGIKTIEWLTFYNCYSLETINIPKSVTLIDQRAFYNCI